MKIAWLAKNTQSTPVRVSPPSSLSVHSNPHQSTPVHVSPSSSVSVRVSPCQFTKHASNNTNKLIIFFAGWGMSHAPFKFLASENSDVLIFFDYTTDEIPIDLPKLLNSYQQIDLIAWSLGVAIANEIMQPYQAQLQTATAINGTIIPIHDNYGIPPAIFSATIDNLLNGGIAGFYRRMCKTAPIRKRFMETPPKREPDNLKKELIALYNKFHNNTPKECIFNQAIISTDDKIVPPDNQAGCWQQFNVPYSLLKAPHFPFYEWSTWREIICQNNK